MTIAHGSPGNVRELRNHLEACIVFGERRIPATAGALPPSTGGRAPVFYEVARRQAVEAFERAYLTEVLAHAGGNVATAARGVGVNRAYLYRLLRRNGMR